MRQVLYLPLREVNLLVQRPTVNVGGARAQIQVSGLEVSGFFWSACSIAYLRNSRKKYIVGKDYIFKSEER